MPGDVRRRGRWLRRGKRARRDKGQGQTRCGATTARSEEHTSELQSHLNLVCRLLLEKKKNRNHIRSDLEFIYGLLLQTTNDAASVSARRQLQSTSRYRPVP